MSKVAVITQPQSLSDVWIRARSRALGGQPEALNPSDLADWAQRFSPFELDHLVIPKRTLARRKARGERLTGEETDKALRLARISAEADRVFGSPEKSASWLRKPNSAWSGQTPLDLLKSETGALAVEELLGQIDHGMFA